MTGGGVADQVHPGAVAAVLRAGRQQLGEHLGRVAVGQPLGDPHVVLVQRVAGGVRVRGPVGAPVGEDREHVVAHRVGVERVGQRARAGRRVVRRHRVHHLRRHQHRHGGPLGLVALEVGVEPLVDQVAEQLAQLLEVLHAVGALPLDRRPLLGGDVLPAREAGPVRLDQLDALVGVGLAGLRGRSTVSMLIGVSCVRLASGRRRVGCASGASCQSTEELRRVQCHAADFPYDPIRRRTTAVTCRSTSDPTGLHRVLDDRGRAAAGGRAARHPPRAVARRGADPRRAAQPRRRVVPPARAQARRATATPSAPRCSTSSRARGKMQNPVTGSGGMLVGTVEEVGPESPLGLAVGDRVATLVSLTLTPLVIEDGLAALGRPRRAGARATATPILFGRSIAAVLPDDLPADLSLAVMDVCGAPALTARRRRRSTTHPVVAVIGGAGKSGSLAPGRGARRRRPAHHRRRAPRGRGRPARATPGSPTRSSSPTPATRSRCATPSTAAGGPADVTVVCVDVPGCEGGAILATADGGTVIFFSMATSFSAAALGRRGAGRRRDHAGRQRLRRPATRPTPWTCCASTPGVRGLFERTAVMAARTQTRRASSTSTRSPSARPARLARKAGRPIVDVAQQHTTVSVERATLRLAGLERRRRRRHPVGQPARSTSSAPTSGSSTASRCRSGTRCVRGEADDLATLAQKAVAGSVRFRLPEGRDADRAPAPPRASQVGAGIKRIDARRRERERLIKRHRRRPAQAVDLPDRRDRRHLRGHPAGAGGRPRGRRRDRGDPLDRPVRCSTTCRRARPARASPAPTPPRRTSG